jgi:twitching motility protein PilI
MNNDHVPGAPPRHTESGADEWLPPCVALGRFSPTEDLLAAGPEEIVVRGRYGFRVGSLSLLIDADTGSEVIRVQNISTLPGSAPWLLGLINLRGNLVPIFDLRLVLGLDGSDGTQTRLVLILDKGEDAVGMIIDDFPQALAAMRPISSLPRLPLMLQEHVRAGYLKEERIWLEFDHESFFGKLTHATAEQL